MLLDTVRAYGFLGCKSCSSIENGSAVTVRTSNSLDWTCNSRNDELISSCQWECKQSQYKCNVHLEIHGYNNYNTAVTYASATVLQHLSYSRHKPLNRLQQVCSSDSSSDTVDSEDESPASSAVSQSPMSSGSSFHCGTNSSRNCCEVLAVLAKTCPLNSLSTCR